MRYFEILCENVGMSDEPHLTRRFDITKLGNRRFMFNPKTKQMLLGDAQGVGKGERGIRGSHAEEFHHVFSSNKGYDDFYIRGWIGAGQQYPHGVIHFAPPIPKPTKDGFEHYYYDGGWNALEFCKSRGGATDQTVVRGWQALGWEVTLGQILGS
jgi:hypothetical protein